MTINDLIALLAATLTVMAILFAIYMIKKATRVFCGSRSKTYKAVRFVRTLGGLFAIEPVLILSALLLLETQPTEKMPNGTTITYHAPTWVVHNGWKVLVFSWGTALLFVLAAPVIKNFAAGQPKRKRRCLERQTGIRYDQLVLRTPFCDT